MRRAVAWVFLLGMGLPPARAGETLSPDAKLKAKALACIAKEVREKQGNLDWEGYTVPVTGLALLSTGSSTREGPYQKELTLLVEKSRALLRKEAVPVQGSAWIRSGASPARPWPTWAPGTTRGTSPPFSKTRTPPPAPTP